MTTINETEIARIQTTVEAKVQAVLDGHAAQTQQAIDAVAKQMADKFHQFDAAREKATEDKLSELAAIYEAKLDEARNAYEGKLEAATQRPDGFLFGMAAEDADKLGKKLTEAKNVKQARAALHEAAEISLKSMKVAEGEKLAGNVRPVIVLERRKAFLAAIALGAAGGCAVKGAQVISARRASKKAALAITAESATESPIV